MRFSFPELARHHVDVLLFRGVENVPALRSKVLNGAVGAALLDAGLVSNLFTVRVASFVAVSRVESGSLISKSVHHEVLYYLSAVRNVGRGLQLVGARDETRDVLIVAVNAEDEFIQDLRRFIDGMEVGSIESGLEDIADEARIRALYKIDDSELECGTLSDAVLMRMAIRDVSRL
mmetsp:Transcript_5309/g.10897  ORF Transcript_5309/g.10897 Transcript_5309/m.10897 type:complete len:176 (-) Transcript_5309:102-629(-)